MSILGLDLDALSRPLTEERPAGVELRTDHAGQMAWAKIRELREEARRIERDADKDSSVERGASMPFWSRAVEACVSVLLTQSRDLSVMAALIEAVCRTQGFRGLAEGCRAAQVMVESGWSTLFPLPDPDDGPADERTIATERALPLVRLAGDDSEGLLVPAIMRIPLVNGRDGERFGLCHWRSSRELAGVDDEERLATAISRGGTSPQQFAAAAATTEKIFFQDVFQDVMAAEKAWQDLAAAVATASDDMALVPTLPVRELCGDCADALRIFAASAIAELQRPAQGGSVGDADDDAASPTTSVGNNAPLKGVLVPAAASRDDILRILDSVASYFESQDPHSLLAFQVRNVVRMARLPPSDYYREIILEESGLQSLSRISGLRFDG